MSEKKQSKLKLFIDNFLVYGFGGIISKMIPLIMVPIITRIMPNSSYFGISDMSGTIVSFTSALAIVGMYDAMYRMFFEKDELEYKKTVCSTTLTFTIGMSIVVFLLMLLFRRQLARWFLKDEALSYVIFLSAISMLVGATNSIISAPTRMQNKRKVFLITNTVSPILSYSISIPLLLKGYYIIALPLAGIIAGITMETAFFIMNRRWFRLGLFDGKLLKQLLRIAIPLFPTFVIYWIFNSSDRIMITNLMDIGAEGVYSVGSKLGHASQLIYTAFAGGWQYFAFSTMKEENQVESNSHVFEYLGIISFAATAFMCALSYALFKILFPSEYMSAYIIAPYLFLAPLLLMLYQVAINQLLVVKKTWPSLFILTSGALLNVLLNFVLIPTLGIEGASIATLAGYAVTVVIASIVLHHMKLMIISKRFLLAVAGMMVFFVVWRVKYPQSTVISFLLACVYCVFCVFLYRDELSSLIKSIGRKARQA